MPVVYLDTQDFSRFGDVLRGRGDPAIAEIYQTLIEFRKNGEATFVISMPLLSELFQYDAENRDLVFAKARAAEELCGPSSIVVPSLVIAIEMARAAADLGLGTIKREGQKINSEREWYPDLSDVLSDYRARLSSAIDDRFANLSWATRKERQRAKTVRKKVTSKIILEAAEKTEFENDLGFPPDLTKSVITGLIGNKISEQQAVRNLFGYIAHPVNFVEFYFEKVDNDRTMPVWLRSLGENLFDSMSQALSRLEAYRIEPSLEKFLRDTMNKQLPKYRIAMSDLAEDDIVKYLNTDLEFEKLKSYDELLSRVPSISVASRLFKRYVEQAIGLHGRKAKLERSFGGDLVHAMYLPSVDLWRGDRRTSAALKAVAPEYAGRVVSKLADLPRAISSARDLK